MSPNSLFSSPILNCVWHWHVLLSIHGRIRSLRRLWAIVAYKKKCTKSTAVENFLPRNAFSSISTVVEYCCIHSLMRVLRRKKNIFFCATIFFILRTFCADREKEGWCKNLKNNSVDIPKIWRKKFHGLFS